MKTINELLADLEEYLKDEIKSSEEGIRYSETDEEYNEYYGRNWAYEHLEERSEACLGS